MMTSRASWATGTPACGCSTAVVRVLVAQRQVEDTLRSCGEATCFTATSLGRAGGHGPPQGHTIHLGEAWYHAARVTASQLTKLFSHLACAVPSLAPCTLRGIASFTEGEARATEADARARVGHGRQHRGATGHRLALGGSARSGTVLQRSSPSMVHLCRASRQLQDPGAADVEYPKAQLCTHVSPRPMGTPRRVASLSSEWSSCCSQRLRPLADRMSKPVGHGRIHD